MAKIEYYFDEMMSRPAAEQLSQRGYKVTMANDVGMTERTDPEHLAYATQHGMVLVTLDRRFAMKAAEEINLSAVHRFRYRFNLFCGRCKTDLNSLEENLREVSPEQFKEIDQESCRGFIGEPEVFHRISSLQFTHKLVSLQDPQSLPVEINLHKLGP